MTQQQVSRLRKPGRRERFFLGECERVFDHIRQYPDLSTNALARECRLTIPQLQPMLHKLKTDERVTFHLDTDKQPPAKHWRVV